MTTKLKRRCVRITVLTFLAVVWVSALTGHGATLVVTSVNSAGAGTLRQAILDSNTNPNPDTITFNIPGGGVKTIMPASALPLIQYPVTIDGTTQAGYIGFMVVELSGAAIPGENGLDFRSGTNTVRGLAINRFHWQIYFATNGNNRVENCFIGTDATGTIPRGGGAGIVLLESPNNIIGGPSAAVRNVISGNTLSGVALAGVRCTNNLIQGNLIGPDVTGEAGLPNRIGVLGGIQVSTFPNATSGPARDVRIVGNVISGNTFDGIQIGYGCSDNIVLSNIIGLTKSGNLLLPNGFQGVGIYDSTNNRIGGPLNGQGNLIAANGDAGIYIGVGLSEVGSWSNRVQGNFIGSTKIKWGNQNYGIHVKSGHGNLIGGFTTNEGNRIAYNGSNLMQHGHGVVIAAGTNNAIVGNQIWANAGRGIDLGKDSFTINDYGDGDTGANGLQNYPVVTRVGFYNDFKEITWTLNSKSNRLYWIEFFGNSIEDPSGFGEGERPLGWTIVLTDNKGFAVFTNQFPLTEKLISATATDLAENNTSEFAPIDTDGDAIADAWEKRGIDFDEDGSVDLHLAGADPMHKDIYLEIDAMTGQAPDMATLNQAAIGADDRDDGFTNAPANLVQNPDRKKGINLHLELDETNITKANWQDDWVMFDFWKPAYFGTAAQRSDANALAAKSLIYHYCIFADQIIDVEHPDNILYGKGEIHGNDLIIGLSVGSSAVNYPSVPGTFMHELGHNLGLRHGGVDDKQEKPNYHSIMNYQWATITSVNLSGWRLDYSHEEFNELDESHLDDAGGIASPNIFNAHKGHKVVIGPRAVNGVPVKAIAVPETGPIDWDGDPGTDFAARDINFLPASRQPSSNDILKPCEDWSRLRFYFLDSPNYQAFAHAEAETNDLPRDVLEEIEKIDTGIGVFQFGVANYSVSETGGVAVITVRRIYEDEGNVSVTFFTSNGTARAGLDFTTVSNTLNFGLTETNKTITIPILNDAVAEAPETIWLFLKNPTGGAKLSPLVPATITIIDDDVPNHYTVINTNNSGAGSLRQAILDANSTTGLALIDFGIPFGSGLTITPTNVLPTITDFVTIDGTTQPGWSNAPIIEINGASAGSVDGLRVAAGDSIIRGFVINRFGGNGINILTNGGNRIEGCYIGLDRMGELDQGNGLNGISVSTSNNIIGGTSPAAGNYISGNNASGILITSSGSTNQIVGNVIGLGVDGSAVGNSGPGVSTSSSGHTIGGTTPGARNVISGNGLEGISATGSRISILGNFIGTDLAGLIARPNVRNGITVGGTMNTIGGTADGAGNVISGNGYYGIELSTASTNILLGNRIGTDRSGMAPLSNQRGGVLVTGTSRNNRIGDTTSPLAANAIAFNTYPGVVISSAQASNNVIRGNNIFSNSGAGIDLGFDGITLNDTNDTDAGANQLQNFPVLTLASNFATGTFIQGTLNSRPNTNYTIDFYANLAPELSGWGEGQFWLGSVNTTTDTNGNASFSASLPAWILRGRYISATATDAAGNTSEFSRNVHADSLTSGRTFTVINEDDSGPGSLRQAILDVNAFTAERNTIAFNIPGPGVHTILPESPLPVVEVPVLIDGYTQPGSSPNTATTGDNAVLLIEIEGAIAGTSRGLVLQGGNSIVRGLVINHFGFTTSTSEAGAIVVRSLGGSRIEGNFIGTDPTGLIRRGTLLTGVHLIGSSSNVVGGTTPAARNVISGIDVLSAGGGSYNVSGEAVALDRINSEPIYPSGNRIEGNLLGPAADGITPLGNQGCGVRFLQPNNDTTIGGTVAGAGNVIAFNGSVAYPVISGGVYPFYLEDGTAILGNSIHSNTGPGIKGDFVNSGDFVAYPHGRGNFPFLGSAISSNSVTIVEGRLNSVSNEMHRIEFFANDVLKPLGHGEGKQFLGWTNTVTDAHGFAVFTAVLPVVLSNGTFITATATDARNNTSEFSPRLTVGDVLTNVIVVNSTDDVDDGTANAAHTSLREAILAANNHPGPDTIRFAIGSGPRTINSTGLLLPALMDTVILDATTQPGFVGQPLIYMDGLLLGTVGFRLYSPSNTVRGFAMNRFSTAIFGDGRYASPFGGYNIIEGNYIGTDRFGLVNGGQDFGIGFSFGCPSNRIGGTTVASRNLISGNNNAGISLSFGVDGNVILGNFIGTDVTGTNRLDNGRGISPTGGIIVQQANGTVIGGSTPGARNVIAANNPYNLYLLQSSSLLVQGNFIGTDSTGNRVWGNSSYGVRLESGLSLVKDNLISGCGTAIFLNSASNRVEGNLIGTDLTGTRALGSQGSGVRVSGILYGNVIGGTNAGARNVISGNQNGVDLGCCGNVVQGNFIGTQADGVSPLGNTHDGVTMQGSSNWIGGLAAAAGNVIAFNSNNGITVVSGTNNAFLGNSIYSNAGLGIDLSGTGLTTNDWGDVDSGANNLQNFPVLTTASSRSADTLIQGTLNSRSNTAFRIDFYLNPVCNASGFGEGRLLLGTITAMTDASSNAPISFQFPTTLPVGQFVTATATDPLNNTSEFSPCVTVTTDTNSVALSLQRFGGTNTLSWPASASGFVLERSTNLNAPITWESWTNGIFTNGGSQIFLLTNDPSFPIQFFRLKKN